MPNGNDEGVGQGNEDFADIQATVLRDLAFSVAKQGGSQVRRGTPIYRQNPVVSAVNKVSLWNAIKDRLCELEYVVDGQTLTIPQHIHHIEEFADAITNDFADILHNNRFRIGIAQKVVGLYLKYLWLFDLTPEPTICPFDRIIIERVLGMNNNWTQFDDQRTYQEIIDRCTTSCRTRFWAQSGPMGAIHVSTIYGAAVRLF